MQYSNKTILDFYKGAYGQTIRIDVHSVAELIKIRDLITKLKEIKIPEISFQKTDSVEITGFCDLIMKVKQKRKFWQSDINTILSENTTSGLVFLWSLTSDGWEHCEGLVDGLIEDGTHGHQYLTKEEDGLIIELSYNE